MAKRANKRPRKNSGASSSKKTNVVASAARLQSAADARTRIAKVVELSDAELTADGTWPSALATLFIEAVAVDDADQVAVVWQALDEQAIPIFDGLWSSHDKVEGTKTYLDVFDLALRHGAHHSLAWLMRKGFHEQIEKSISILHQLAQHIEATDPATADGVALAQLFKKIIGPKTRRDALDMLATADGAAASMGRRCGALYRKFAQEKIAQCEREAITGVASKVAAGGYADPRSMRL